MDPEMFHSFLWLGIVFLCGVLAFIFVWWVGRD